MAAQATSRHFAASDVNLPLRIRIGAIEGVKPAGIGPCGEEIQPHGNRARSDLFVEAQLVVAGMSLGPAVRTVPHANQSTCSIHEWLTLPIRYSDVPPSAHIALTVYDAAAVAAVVGGCSVPLVDGAGAFSQGHKRLQLVLEETGIAIAQPGRPLHHSKASTSTSGFPSELERLEELVKQYQKNLMPRVAWLDKLTFQSIERRNQGAPTGVQPALLSIDLPEFEYPIRHENHSNIANAVRTPMQTALVIVDDPEVGLPSPADTKHFKLAKSLLRGLVDRELKPSSTERRMLESVLSKSSLENTAPEQRELLWKYRFWLSRDARALTKILRLIDWEDEDEKNHAKSLLKQWEPIGTAEALELLSEEFATVPLFVREYAVDRLEQLDDEELALFLLQLVEALRYGGNHNGPLARFLAERTSASMGLGSFFHWFLTVSGNDQTHAHEFQLVHRRFLKHLVSTEEGRLRAQHLQQQSRFVQNLAKLMQEVRSTRENRLKRMGRLKTLIESEAYADLVRFPKPFPLPHLPHVIVHGIDKDSLSLYKSALMPLGMAFVSNAGEPRVIAKHGDDLRQDQLIIQMIRLMDELLKRENLDLRLSPYSVLATSVESGFVEYVPSKTLARVLSENKNDIQLYFRKLHPDEDGPYGIKAEILDTFVKSCAGYCVISYILGIGDRHLDNLLLTDDGKLFHVDFGYILGRDPKPFPPPMKLCKEMVEAMGGASSEHYQAFQSFCCEAYNILRKNGKLFINLFVLMKDARIPGIVHGNNTERNLLRLQEKLALHVSDEEAVQLMRRMISESVQALFAQVVEKIHQWKQYWTK